MAHLIAGSTPGGRVYIIDPAKGEARQLAKLSAEHVWSLAHDAKTGITYAGTGGGGKVYAIDAKGGVKQLWDSGDKQVVSLVSFGGGVLLRRHLQRGRAVPGGGRRPGHRPARLRGRRGTGHPARGHRDLRRRERLRRRRQRCARVQRNDDDHHHGLRWLAGPAAKGTRISLGSGSSTSATPSGGRSGAARGKGAVYRVDDGGGIEQVFALSDGYLTALLADQAGASWPPPVPRARSTACCPTEPSPWRPIWPSARR